VCLVLVELSNTCGHTNRETDVWPPPTTFAAAYITLSPTDIICIISTARKWWRQRPAKGKKTSLMPLAAAPIVDFTAANYVSPSFRPPNFHRYTFFCDLFLFLFQILWRLTNERVHQKNIHTRSTMKPSDSQTDRPAAANQPKDPYLCPCFL
jgi:hypothetical protein